MSAPTPALPPLPLRNCYWVVPGLLLAGEHPNGANREKTRDRLNKLLAAGIECFIDLTRSTELLRYDVHLPSSVRYIRKPIRDHGLPGSPGEMIEILDVVAKALRSGRPTYVHCRAGIGRTGTVIGCLLVERGLSGDGALDELNRLWLQCKRSKSWPLIPETEEQAAYVRDWTARLAAGGFDWGPATAAVAARMSVAGEDLSSGTVVPAIQARALRQATPAEVTAGGVPPGRSRPAKPDKVGKERLAAIAESFVIEPSRKESARLPNVELATAESTARRQSAGPVTPLEPSASFPSTTYREHHAQEAPAHQSDPLLEPSTLAAARGLRERVLGALSGLAVGDAVAAATQYRRPGTFAPVGDMIGGGPFDLPRGAWSDDTAMALCLAESLLECNGFDARDQAQRYGRWQSEGYLSSTGQCVGITASTARALAMAKWRRVMFAGSHDPEQLDPEPLSRIGPVALYFLADLDATVQHAADSARTTCQAPAVLESCRRLARALHAALWGQSKAKILAEIQPSVEALSNNNGTAPTALAAAYWSFGTTDNFREAVLRAANVGGNSDVVASVCGQLAGAHYGVSAIPASWRNGLSQKDLIEGVADRLLAHGLVSLGG
jgi:ADP-ribosyl-[dinitrogen reductase] hydrolase